MSYEMDWKYEDKMKANPQFKEKDMEALRRWIRSDNVPNNIPKDLSDSMLLCFYNASFTNVEHAKKRIKAYFSSRERAPELFDNRDLNQQSLQAITQSFNFVVSPHRTNEDHLVMIAALCDPNPDNFNFNAFSKMLFMTGDRCLMDNGPTSGFAFFLDIKYLRLGHLTKMNVITLSKMFTYVQEGLHSKMNRFNIMNAGPFLNKLIAILKPFMSKELYSMIHLYESDIDYEKFHLEVAPKRCLPSEYHGDLPDLATMDQENRQKLMELANKYEKEEIHRYKYLKRERKLTKVEEKFQNLSVD